MPQRKGVGARRPLPQRTRGGRVDARWCARRGVLVVAARVAALNCLGVEAQSMSRGLIKKSSPSPWGEGVGVRGHVSRAIRRHIGQLLLTGFGGTQIPAELRSLSQEFDLGGVILFSRNVEAPEQVAELSLATQELAQQLPLWFAVDQEGGRVARLKEGFTRWPAMATLGRAQDVQLA